MILKEFILDTIDDLDYAYSTMDGPSKALFIVFFLVEALFIGTIIYLVI